MSSASVLYFCWCDLSSLMSDYRTMYRQYTAQMLRYNLFHLMIFYPAKTLQKEKVISTNQSAITSPKSFNHCVSLVVFYLDHKVKSGFVVCECCDIFIFCIIVLHYLPSLKSSGSITFWMCTVRNYSYRILNF